MFFFFNILVKWSWNWIKNKITNSLSVSHIFLYVILLQKKLGDMAAGVFVFLSLWLGPWTSSRLLVKEHIAQIAKLRNPGIVEFRKLIWFKRKSRVLGLVGWFPKTSISVLANQHTAHYGEANGCMVCSCSCWRL